MTSTATKHVGWYSDEAATFGDRVAGAREVLGMTQEDLSRRLGVQLKTISSWENDMSEPRANKLQMLAGILNVSMRWLLTGEGHGPDGSTARDLPEEVAALLRELSEARDQIVRASERMAVIERRLRTVCREDAE